MAALATLISLAFERVRLLVVSPGANGGRLTRNVSLCLGSIVMGRGIGVPSLSQSAESSSLAAKYSSPLAVILILSNAKSGEMISRRWLPLLTSVLSRGGIVRWGD